MQSTVHDILASKLERFLSHGTSSVGRDKALVIRRARGFALLGLVVVFLAGFVMSGISGWPRIALGSLAAMVFMIGGLALGYVQQSRWVIPVTHVGMGGMLCGILSAAVHVGHANDISSLFPIVLILVSMYVLGVRASLFWTAASMAGMAYVVAISEVPVDQAGTALITVPGLIVIRWLGMLGVFVIAAVERRFADRQSRELEYLARHDPLTNLYNRRAFDERVEDAISRVDRYARRIALIAIDLDGFKSINDQHGHAAGDELLRVTGTRIAQQIRSTDSAGRVGGDEYLILMEDIDEDKHIQLFAERLALELAEPTPHGDVALQVGVSIGIATLPEAASDAEGLTHAADIAMYAAKSRGGNNVAFHRPGPGK
jgi:diguanylate cyclase (GGDEF)-like protein